MKTYLPSGCALPSEPLPPPFMCKMVTPLKPAAWMDKLQLLSDPLLVGYLISGMQHESQIGINRQSSYLVSAKSNMQSALLNCAPVQFTLTKEQQADQSLYQVVTTGSPPEPLPHSPTNGGPSWTCTPLTITASTMASPQKSVRCLITRLFIMSQLGQDSFLAKIDIAHAYRNVPVHPSNRRLLGRQWMAPFLSIWYSPLASAPPQTFFQPQLTPWNGSSGATKSPMYRTIWTISSRPGQRIVHNAKAI